MTTTKQKIANLFGYELIKLKKHPTLESHLMNMLKHHNIDTVLDVGANVGEFGKMIRKRGYVGTIHSFEPVQELYDQLNNASENDSNWYSHKMALGSKNEDKQINIMNKSTFSSFQKLSDFGRQKFPKVEPMSHEIVNISTVNDFISQTIIEPESKKILLKIDTQGYDIEVFRGSLSSIQNITLILTEMSIQAIYTQTIAYLDFLQELNTYGFIVTGIYPISRRKEDFSLVEVDCILVNTQLS